MHVSALSKPVSGPEIAEINVFKLRAPLAERFGYAQGWVDSRTATLVRVESRDGTVGWGECFGPLAGTGEIIEELLAPEVIGADPRSPDALYEHCYELGRRSYQTSVPLAAISGLNIAIWDLYGRIVGESVAALAGGRRRETVRAYATGHYFRDTNELEQQIAGIATEAETSARSLGALKLKVGLARLGFDQHADVELVEAVIDRVPPETTVMVDANYAYEQSTALHVGETLHELGVAWFEEPIRPEHEAAYRSLTAELGIPVAAGECHTPAALGRLIDQDAIDIAQPDVCAIGGMTPAAQVSRTAATAGIEVIPHIWGTGLAQAASLQLIATLPGDPWAEWDRSPNPLRTAVVPDAPSPDEDGIVVIPTGPGLGVEPDEAAIEAFRT